MKLFSYFKQLWSGDLNVKYIFQDFRYRFYSRFTIKNVIINTLLTVLPLYHYIKIIIHTIYYDAVVYGLIHKKLYTREGKILNTVKGFRIFVSQFRENA